MAKVAELGQLESIYLFANTPLYLYRELRQHPSILQLALEEGSEEQVGRISAILEGERTPLLIAEAYGRLVAILLRDQLELEPIPESLKTVRGLDWLDFFVEWSSSRAATSSHITINSHLVTLKSEGEAVDQQSGATNETFITFPT